MKMPLKSALLISESYIWGIWLFNALQKAKIEVEPILGEEIDKVLENYQVLFVPGGWASNKIEKLKEKGKESIKNFLEKGGIYIGICGGAGLATLEGLKIAKIKRKKRRVPSFSGPAEVRLNPHPLWEDIKRPRFFLWWPSEFQLLDNNLKILATFKKPLKGAFTSDLYIEDYKDDFSKLEKVYKINLDPERMSGSPLVIEGNYKKGKFILSLIHFDTPGDKNGLKVFANLAEYLNLEKLNTKGFSANKISFSSLQKEVLKKIKNYLQLAEDMISVGKRNFLLFKRYPFIYHWKRGVKGLECQNIYYLLLEIKKILQTKEIKRETLEKIENSLFQLEPIYKRVISCLKELFIYQRFKDKCEKIRELDCEIFGGNAKHYGGLYLALIQELEKILYFLWKEK